MKKGGSFSLHITEVWLNKKFEEKVELVLDGIEGKMPPR